MNNNDIRLLITAGLNEGSSISEIDNSIKKLQKVVNKRQLNIKLNIDQKALNTLNQFNKQMEAVGVQAMNSKKLVEELFNSDGSSRKITHYTDGTIGESIKEASKSAEKLKNETKLTTQEANKLSSTLNNINKQEESARKSEQRYTSEREKALQYEQRVRKAIADKAQSEREKALQYEQKASKAVSGTLQKEEETTREIQRQLDLRQREIRMRAQEVSRQFPSIDKKSIADIVSQANSYDTEGKSLKQLNNDFGDLNLRMKETVTQTKQVTANTNTMAGALQNALIKFPIKSRLGLNLSNCWNTLRVS